MNIPDEVSKEILYFYGDVIKSRMESLNLSKEEAIEAIYLDLELDWPGDETEKNNEQET